MNTFEGRKNSFVILAVLASGCVLAVKSSPDPLSGISPKEPAFEFYDNVYRECMELYNGKPGESLLLVRQLDELHQIVKYVSEKSERKFKSLEKLVAFEQNLYADVGCATGFIRKYKGENNKILAALLYVHYLTFFFHQNLSKQFKAAKKEATEKGKTPEESSEEITKETAVNQSLFLLKIYFDAFLQLGQDENILKILGDLDTRKADEDFLEVEVKFDLDKVEEAKKKFSTLRRAVLESSGEKMIDMNEFIRNLLQESGLTASLPIISNTGKPTLEMVANLKLWDMELRNNESVISKFLQAIMRITPQEEVATTSKNEEEPAKEETATTSTNEEEQEWVLKMDA